MSETVSRSMGKTIAGLALLLVSFVGMAMIAVGVLESVLATAGGQPDNPIWTFFVLGGLALGVPCFVIGLFMLLAKKQ